MLTSNYEWFRNISTPYGTSTGTARIIPVHLIGEDMSWNHGAHNIRFGGNFRYVTNQSQSFANSYSSASSNPSWLNGSGNDLLPATLGVSSSFKQNYEYAMAAVLGLEAQGNADYNYKVDGTVLPVGAPVSRNFANKETEMYAQDTWKVTREFTITPGIRLGSGAAGARSEWTAGLHEHSARGLAGRARELCRARFVAAERRADRLHPCEPGVGHVSLPQELGPAHRSGICSEWR